MRSECSFCSPTCFPSLLLAFGIAAGPCLAFAQDKDASAPSPAISEAASGIVAQPDHPATAPDPNELLARPDGEGKVRFNFQGQPWPQILQWLADVSRLNLDWQELPPGNLNLHSQRSYTVDEARDLINRYLLERGFTLLKHGEVLSAVNIRKLDNSLVPRLEPDQLSEAQPHEFARVSFPLEWMTAEAAAEELKALVSANGRLTALKASNQLEVLDTVVNLRQIAKLLGDKESPRGSGQMVREFPLKHVKAVDVEPQLQQLLGIDKASRGTDAENAALVRQMAQLIRGGGEAPRRAGPGRPEPPPVYLVANVRDNSILAHAPADQMAVIAEAVRMIDKPSDKSRSLLRNSNRVQVYPLTSAEPETVARMLQELGDLSPETRVQVEKKGRAIIAHANLADHLTIRTLIDKLDATTRSFRVIALRRLDAEFVAGSIDLVMGGGGDRNNRRPAGREGEDESRRFRVVADLEKNRLLLWVNDEELDDVRHLLAELGEVADGADAADVRILDVDSDEREELLRRLKDLWPKVAPNPLDLGPDGATEPPRAPRERQPGAEPAPETPKSPSAKATAPQRRDPVAARPGPAKDQEIMRLVRLPGDERSREPASASQDSPNPAPKAPSGIQTDTAKSAAPPATVRIRRDESGRLLLSSPDAAALDLLEKLVDELAPATRQDFKTFRMKHRSTWAYGVAKNLEQFFKARQKASEPAPRWFDPSNPRPVAARDATAAARPQRRLPEFIVDSDSNSVLAVGADAQQLKIIEELVEMYDDTSGAREPNAVRNTRLIRVKYGQARLIAETVKDVYRDLLGEPATQPRGQRNERSAEPTYTFVYPSGTGGDGEQVQAKFKGQLSIGVDEVANGLVVSAPEALLTEVETTIKTLDEEARLAMPSVQVLRIHPAFDHADLQKRLERVFVRQRSTGSSQPQQRR